MLVRPPKRTARSSVRERLYSPSAAAARSSALRALTTSRSRSTSASLSFSLSSAAAARAVAAVKLPWPYATAADEEVEASGPAALFGEAMPNAAMSDCAVVASVGEGPPPLWRTKRPLGLLPTRGDVAAMLLLVCCCCCCWCGAVVRGRRDACWCQLLGVAARRCGEVMPAVVVVVVVRSGDADAALRPRARSNDDELAVGPKPSTPSATAAP